MPSMSFMSTAPRPMSIPESSMTASYGACDQSRAMAGTTSMWPCTSIAGAAGSLPGTRNATARRESDVVVMTSGCHPTSRSTCAM